MDVFDYRKNHTLKTQGVFDGNNAISDELSGMFMRLKNLMSSEILANWDIVFLKQYVGDKMVPAPFPVSAL